MPRPPSTINPNLLKVKPDKLLSLYRLCSLYTENEIMIHSQESEKPLIQAKAIAFRMATFVQWFLMLEK